MERKQRRALWLFDEALKVARKMDDAYLHAKAEVDDAKAYYERVTKEHNKSFDAVRRECIEELRAILKLEENVEFRVNATYLRDHGVAFLDFDPVEVQTTDEVTH